MADAHFTVPTPINEPVRAYSASDPTGLSQRASLQATLDCMASDCVDIPCVIGGREVRTNEVRSVVMPHSHREKIAIYSWAGAAEMAAAVEAAQRAKPAWESMQWQDRAAIFLKAADLLAGPYRDVINAATMLGQSKNVFQAEIDAACELIDFLRFNAKYYEQILQQQPLSVPGVWNRLEYRPLEGFVLAITPFNFTAIAANLCAAPALAGNTVVWKPSDTQMLSAHYIMKLFKEAGLPDGVINMIPADGPLTGKTLLSHRDLGGVHFTGSTSTFQSIWRSVGENVASYRSYPRVVGETGGKDFVFAHPSADAAALATALVRGAFEYQGQKCSAASRAYIPRSLWAAVSERIVADVKSFKMGDVRDFGNFVNAVIDERSFNKIAGYLKAVRNDSSVKVLVGGACDSSMGYFVEPTVLVCESPTYRTMVDELFGPVLSVYVYDDAKFEETLAICDQTSPYALTGAIFSQDRQALARMSVALRNAAGNFYINDKPTGAVVGQQPFGGARASGTNDKAGSALNLYRWISPRTIKETLVPPTDYRYPFLG